MSWVSIYVHVKDEWQKEQQANNVTIALEWQ